MNMNTACDSKQSQVDEQLMYLQDIIVSIENRVDTLDSRLESVLVIAPPSIASDKPEKLMECVPLANGIAAKTRQLQNISDKLHSITDRLEV